jgi:hypothetical protein
MGEMFRHARALFALAWVLAVSGAARAEATRSADALFDEGSGLLKAGRVEEACVKLGESQSVEPAIGTLGLLAYCHEQLGKLATAMREYGQVAELAHLASQGAREKVARERVADLASRVTRLSIALSDRSDGLEVYLDGRRLSEIELGASTPVDPGIFELQARAKGFESWRQSLTIPADGSTLRVIVPRLQPMAAAPVAAGASMPTATPVARRDSGLRRPAIWASVGVGVAGLAVGSAFGLSAMAARSDASPHCQGNRCDQVGVDARDRAFDRARVSTIAFGVAAVGVAAGAILIFTGEHEVPRQQAALSVVPGGAAVSWERRF